MKMTRWKKSLSFIVCIVLIAAMALILTGCNANTNETTPTVTEVPEEKGNILGEGEKEFHFTVTDDKGVETAFVIRTDKSIVGEALMDVGLLAGEEGPYGLYVKTVNGLTVDYDKDGKYWSFYVNGEYAMSGVDMTEIVEGESYAFKVE